ncbi:MAG: DUF433 domain-containing protein [Rubrobacter sp.]|nr:DUF433 domain-containing protein [Rubrobacter sp.]
MSRSLIVSNPEVMMGKPVVRGTRITVDMILEKLSEGESVEQILSEHSGSPKRRCGPFAGAAIRGAGRP